MSNATFCDYLNVTVPLDCSREAHDSIRPILLDSGAAVEQEGLYRVGTGVVRLDEKFNVMRISASGAALATLRAVGLFNQYLSELAQHPHRVTMLHATHDVPGNAPAELRKLTRRAYAGSIKLTRKAIPSDAVKRIVGRGVDGRETGTIYIGRRTAEVWCKVYDKRQERLDKGAADCGPLLRYELCATSKVGITLRDAANSDALFWHFMAPGVLPRPGDVPTWTPFAEGGFDLPKRQEQLPAISFVRRLENSAELRSIIEQADELGPYGRSMLRTFISKAAARPLRAPLEPLELASAVSGA